jgi:hypothetical protein
VGADGDGEGAGHLDREAAGWLDGQLEVRMQKVVVDRLGTRQPQKAAGCRS